MADLSLKKLTKAYGQVEVLHGIDLDISDGEFVVFVGPSGCGKSTSLRMIAGLEEITGGEIWIDGRMVNNLEPKERDIAMVFQNYAIYPHMTVRKNIAFGLWNAPMSKSEKSARIEEVARVLDMDNLLDRKPSQLSGGQRQRVAIGRAMVRNPAVFLFDEPLSNLDAQLRTQMRLEIKKLHQKVGNTIIFVTHDQVEAMTLADRIVIMKDGFIQQIGTPEEVFHNPVNAFVAQFIGAPSMNMLEATGNGQDLSLRNGEKLPLQVTTLTGQKLLVGIRPDDLVLHPETPLITGNISVREPLGSETLIYVSSSHGEIVARVPGKDAPRVGEEVHLGANPDSLHVFDAESGAALV
ncbi:MAG: sn-glycerol-3-phosphate ABC transporter ATP-binding protein UgpC [Roseibium sp.]|uniref:ABC transporter ATP-binding protein n=1 Tax=Roseibium sp. TaxID=1936156 RepID=UPI00261A98D0|nr:sn-glycerol-3-phosphate ABC transporter ATP-binding protein UgpC [Roseibium sp.]MCV0426974.1 sn-glycerol-3-phosphate ABC transporter ATP-binding protein UgpC [Roseibium sp.]